MAQKSAAFRLLVITPEATFLREQQWVNRLFEAGLPCLHLRKPGWQLGELMEYLKGIEVQYHSRVMVHHHPRLLEYFALQGVHLQQTALPEQKPAFTLSCPVHSWQEFGAAAPRVDYALLSPFFNSLSKRGYAANEQLWNVPAGVNRQKAIALGGIDGARLGQVQQLGLGGAALLGAIWQSANPLKAFLKINEKLNNV